MSEEADRFMTNLEEDEAKMVMAQMAKVINKHLARGVEPVTILVSLLQIWVAGVTTLMPHDPKALDVALKNAGAEIKQGWEDLDSGDKRC